MSDHILDLLGAYLDGELHSAWKNTRPCKPYP